METDLCPLPWGTAIGWNTCSTSLQAPLVPLVSSVSEELVMLEPDQ